MYKAALSLQRLGKTEKSLSLTESAMDVDSPSKELVKDLQDLRFTLFLALGEKTKALETLVYLSKNAPLEAQRTAYLSRAIDFVDSQLSEEEVRDVASDREFRPVRPYAYFRLGLILFESREFSDARYYLREVSDLLPDSEISERSQALVKQIDERSRVEPLTIGTILPLSGRHSGVAEDSLRGLLLGLGIYGSPGSQFKLAVIDSEGNPDKARRAVEKLVTEDHVVAIVGSLLSKTSNAVASKANELGVPVIGLSQKSDLTEMGNNVFRNALTSKMLVEHLVKIAMEQEGLRKFAIVYPNDRYGVEFANLFWDEVLTKGGKITAAQTYEPKETDFNGVVQRLVGTYYLEDRKDEYELLLKDWLKQQARISLRIMPPDDLLPPVIDFDAVFIPDSTRALGQIAPMLAYHNVRKVKLLGTNLWNSRSLVERGQQYIENSLFVDSFLTSTEAFKRSKCFGQYKSTFGDSPGLFSTQAYDAGLILRQILASGEKTRVGVRERLNELTSFPGCLGPLEMSQNRELNRPVVGLTVNKGRIVPL
jgi:ABC-type branched-subunit amino acid transport system substrate-binding protein